MHVGPVSLDVYLALAVSAIAIVVAIPTLFLRPRWVIPAVIVALFGLIAFLIPVGPGSFESIHVLYAVLTWSIPAVGVVTIASSRLNRRRKHPRLRASVGAILLIPGAIGYYATNVEPRHLEVNRYSLGATGERNLRVVVLSDIQSPNVGSFERKVAKTASSQNADLILYPGDLYSGEDNAAENHFNDFVSLVADLDAPSGTYFVPGDHDGDDQLPAIVKAAGKTFMQQDMQVVSVRGMRVAILGLDTDYSTDDANQLLRNLADRTDVDYKIVLDHKPDTIFNTPDGIDLVVAGHTHGGQVQIPLYGPVMTLSSIPRKQAGGGVFDYSGGRKLFVTRGIGEEHGGAPIVRFNDPPQIAVLNIGLNKER